jgi:SAM-dependent methyltransferase
MSGPHEIGHSAIDANPNTGLIVAWRGSLARMSQRTEFRTAARDVLMYGAGLVFLTLAKAKHIVRGYSSPKPFPLTEIERSIAYDLKVVDEWLLHLAAYAGESLTVSGKNVLELGPGSDLGVGLYLVAKGAAAYYACDVHDLTQSAPDSFYSALIERVVAIHGECEAEVLKSQLENARTASPSKLRVAVRSDFDLVAAFGKETMDLVFSQAAFEHFDDVDCTVEQLSAVCRPGATIVAEIDLKTHSRWIHDKDPNNIYRYPDWIYRIFSFRGMPNRVRPYQYRRAFERHGWENVAITPIERTTTQHPGAVYLDNQFRAEKNEMSHLSIVLCAQKPKADAGNASRAAPT